MNSDTALPSQWRGFYSYVLVTTGAVVGLGNVFQFPFQVINYGGAFLFFYILFEVLITIPLFFAEIIIGRRGKLNPVSSMMLLSMESDASHFWYKVGWVCVTLAFLTLSYYAVNAAFPVDYFLNAVNILITHGIHATANIFTIPNILAKFSYLEAEFIIFLLFTFWVIVRGIKRGLETISCIIVPLYFVVLLALAVYISVHSHFLNTLDALFKLHSEQSYLIVMAAALAYAFLKLGAGMGTMIVYGSYLPYSVPLIRSTITIIIIDAVISILSYFIIYPLMQGSGLDVISRINVFAIFGGIPEGALIAALFFFACILAAWAPTIAMAETVVVTVMSAFHWSRTRAACIIGLCIAILGTCVVGTHTIWADTHWFGMLTYDVYHSIIANFLAPLSALLVTLFAGWALQRHVTESELEMSPLFYNLWRFLVRYVAPVVIFVILISAVINLL